MWILKGFVLVFHLDAVPWRLWRFHCPGKHMKVNMLLNIVMTGHLTSFFHWEHFWIWNCRDHKGSIYVLILYETRVVLIIASSYNCLLIEIITNTFSRFSFYLTQSVSIKEYWASEHCYTQWWECWACMGILRLERMCLWSRKGFQCDEKIANNLSCYIFQNIKLMMSLRNEYLLKTFIYLFVYLKLLLYKVS